VVALTLLMSWPQRARLRIAVGRCAGRRVSTLVQPGLAGTDGGRPMQFNKSASLFTRFAKKTARLAGRPIAFLCAVGIIVVWALTGPIFGFNDTWQLVINTGTTIITFLMVFLIQNTQNRDSEAVQVKLDELIRAIEGADNALLDLEELEDDDLDRLREDYEKLAREARNVLKRRDRKRATAST
jgi:low affinity Fe/Cu permease